MVLAAVTGMLLEPAAWAGAIPHTIVTVADLDEVCTSPGDSTALQTCDAYIQGIKDWMQLAGDAANSSSVSAEEHDAEIPFIACDVPDTEHVRQAFHSWLEKNPNYRKDPAAMGVWTVISGNWPCKLKIDPQPPH